MFVLLIHGPIYKTVFNGLKKQKWLVIKIPIKALL
jgi:hypothetical protein